MYINYDEWFKVISQLVVDVPCVKTNGNSGTYTVRGVSVLSDVRIYNLGW